MSSDFSEPVARADGPRRVLTGKIIRREVGTADPLAGFKDSLSAWVESVSDDDRLFRSSERILVAAFCGTCNLPVMRKFDIVINELVIQPWEHASRIPIAHSVGEIRMEPKHDC